MAMRAPSYAGGGLVNLMATIERHLIGTAPMPPLQPPDLVPAATGYVLVLFDGLGAHQLHLPEAAGLRAAAKTTLTAGFPTTTTTSLATMVTGLPPVGHGIIGHILHLPGVAELVNVLKWITPDGRPVDHDYAGVLPGPNLWERLASGGIEPITVQPGAFLGSPLSQMLYRGCRFEPIWSTDELVAATLDLAGPGRLVVPYFSPVDVTAHVEGQTSRAYHNAVVDADRIWAALSARLRADVVTLGTADHGHIDYGPESKHLIRDRRYDSLRLFGDPRSLFVAGDEALVKALATEAEGQLIAIDDAMEWFGPPPWHPELEKRLPEWVLLAPPGRVLLPRPFDKRLIGYHGGLQPEEVEIPLLVRA